MATVPPIQAEDDVFAHIASSGVIPERYLARGVDKMGMLSFITRGTTRFLGMINARFPKSKIVNTREHRIQEINELDRVLEVTVASSVTDNHTTVGVSNAQAAQLILQDVLYVSGLFMEIKGNPLNMGQVWATAAGGTVNTVPTSAIPPMIPSPMGYQPASVNYSQTFGQSSSDPTLFFVNYEPVLLVAKGAPNSGGTGNTTLTFQRCWCTMGVDQGGWIVGLNAPALVTTGTNTGDAGKILAGTHQLLRGLPTFPEGGDAPTGLHRNPYIDNNFTQEFKYAVEITKELLIEKNWMNKSYLEIEKMVRSRQSALDMERTFLFGRKGKSQDYAGKVMYTMGGVIEFIKRDSDHILKYTQPSLSYQGFLDFTDNVFKLGGATERDMYVGLGLYTQMKKAMYGSGYMRYDENATANFDIEIESIMGAGGKLNVIPCYTLTEAKWDNRAIIIDNSLNAFVPTTHDGWDMKVETDIQEKGQQIYKEQMIGIKGLERRYSQYHCICDFSF